VREDRRDGRETGRADRARERQHEDLDDQARVLQIGVIRLLHEGSIGAGMRRVEALVGHHVHQQEVDDRQDRYGRHEELVADVLQLVPLASSRGGIQSRSSLGISDHAKYFNAGVMLIDLARWRAARVADSALNYLRAHWKSVAFWDQEGLNVALAGQWMELAPRWNRNVSVPGDRALGAVDGSILHFAGRLKPWLYKIRDPEFSLYLSYLDRTSWKGSRPARGVGAAIVSLYERSGIRSLLHPLENLLADVARKSFRETMLNTASQSQ